MRRLVPIVMVCALLATACGDLVRVEVRVDDLRPVPTPAQSHIFAADGSRIATLRLANREKAKLRELPAVLLRAVVAAEDRRFYVHDGVDLRAIGRAALANQRAGRVVEGGSTITQQLIKNRYFPDAPESFGRKIGEAKLAYDLEARHSKKKILVEYLNTIYFGAGAYGVIAASRAYFGLPPRELTLRQAALLVGLIRSPESASPYEHPRRARRVRNAVLAAMAEQGLVAPGKAAATARRALGVRPRPAPPRTRYPHFVEYVKRRLLADPSFGVNEKARIRRLYGGGLRIHTTIDPRIQSVADDAAGRFIGDDPQVGIAVVRPADGHLLALHGGRDFDGLQYDLATQARRQAGSTFKTFALVAALRQGARLHDVYESSSAFFDLEGSTWSVRSSTSGPLTLARATALSSNGVFARLAVELGGQRIADQAHSMGVNSPIGNNPAIVLGGLRRGVTVLDMASAYGTLANGGIHTPVVAVTHVTDEDGDVLWRAPKERTVVMDGATAWFATKALQGVIEHGTGTAARLGRPAAGKTGTVQSYSDAWFVGYSPQLSTAVWMGYPDAPRPLLSVHGVSRVSGGSWPARIWREVMLGAHANRRVRRFRYPEHLSVTVQVDPQGDCLATEESTVVENWTGLPGELPAAPCEYETGRESLEPPPMPARAEPVSPPPPLPPGSGELRTDPQRPGDGGLLLPDEGAAPRQDGPSG